MSRRYPLSLTACEDRVVPVVTPRAAVGATAADVTVAVNTFRADLGALNPNNPGSLGAGRREINWDANAGLDATASPALMPADFFNPAAAPFARGAVFSSPGKGVVVSQDNDGPTDADADQVEFDDIMPGYSTHFAAFSAQRLFAPAGSNVLDVTFRVPGSVVAAGVRGFGAVFTDVDTAGSSTMEFFDLTGKSVWSGVVPAVGGDGTFSFLGASFAPGDAERVARVRIVAGSAPLATGTIDVSAGGASINGPADLVALDDFIYAEPAALPGPFAVGPGVGNVAQLRNPDGSKAAEVVAFSTGYTGGVRVASADFNGDGARDLAMGTGPGVATQVRVVSGKDNAELFNTNPYEAAFTGGVFVAVGDVNGDGTPDLIVTPDEGGGPRVRVFNGAAKFAQLIPDFLGIDDPNFRGGARATAGDFNGDGFDEVVVAAGFGGGPRVTAWDGKGLSAGSPAALFNFFVFETGLRNGAYVAAGDVNGDGLADLIAGGGPNGGPRVRVLAGGADDATLANFFVGDVTTRAGVRVASADIDGDELADIVTGQGAGLGTRVTAFAGKALAPTGTPAAQFDLDAFGGTSGVFVG